MWRENKDTSQTLVTSRTCNVSRIELFIFKFFVELRRAGLIPTVLFRDSYYRWFLTERRQWMQVESLKSSSCCCWKSWWIQSMACSPITQNPTCSGFPIKWVEHEVLFHLWQRRWGYVYKVNHHNAWGSWCYVLLTPCDAVIKLRDLWYLKNLCFMIVMELCVHWISNWLWFVFPLLEFMFLKDKITIV